MYQAYVTFADAVKAFRWGKEHGFVKVATEMTAAYRPPRTDPAPLLQGAVSPKWYAVTNGRLPRVYRTLYVLNCLVDGDLS